MHTESRTLDWNHAPANYLDSKLTSAYNLVLIEPQVVGKTSMLAYAIWSQVQAAVQTSAGSFGKNHELCDCGHKWHTISNIITAIRIREEQIHFAKLDPGALHVMLRGPRRCQEKEYAGLCDARRPQSYTFKQSPTWINIVLWTSTYTAVPGWLVQSDTYSSDLGLRQIWHAYFWFSRVLANDLALAFWLFELHKR